MFHWTDDMIRYMADAGRQTDFHRRLTAELLPYLSPQDRVCDAGCGLGFLSLALAPHVRHVTAADCDAQALSVLKEELAARHIENVTPLCTDIFTDRLAEPYDAMVFCLFGGTDEILDIAARQCGGTALVVRRDFRQHQFSSGVRMAGHTAADMEQELRRRGLTCTLRRFTLEFGQPFRSVEDALTFFRLYSRDGTAPARQELEARLEPSPWPDYPLYLPNPKPLCLLAIPAAQLKEGSHG